MAIVKSGIFSNPGTGFSNSNRKTNQSPNGSRGGVSDADFAFVNGKPNNSSAATTSIDPSKTRLDTAGLSSGGGYGSGRGGSGLLPPGAETREVGIDGEVRFLDSGGGYGAGGGGAVQGLC